MTVTGDTETKGPIMYQVHSYERLVTGGQNDLKHHVSEGFSTREAAEKFAAGLAASGKCVSADIFEDSEPKHRG